MAVPATACISLNDVTFVENYPNFRDDSDRLEAYLYLSQISCGVTVKAPHDINFQAHIATRPLWGAAAPEYDTDAPDVYLTTTKPATVPRKMDVATQVLTKCPSLSEIISRCYDLGVQRYAVYSIDYYTRAGAGRIAIDDFAKKHGYRSDHVKIDPAEIDVTDFAPSEHSLPERLKRFYAKQKA